MEAMILGYHAEELELHLFDIFREQGFARSPLEMVHCLECDLFSQRKEVNVLRVILIVRFGLEKIAHGILKGITKEERKERVLLLENEISTPLKKTDLIGDIFTIEEFIEMCKDDCFNDYDGFGHYATVDREYNKYAIPSEAALDVFFPNPKYTHVVWYNK